ncbi:MAG: mechanosensitive ion channel family protein [Ruminococcaceae bacterium]|nr:mechanosensitive ion channel family protein [Oscillospiraceae bacterium]
MWETIKAWLTTQGLSLATRVLVAVTILVVGILVCRVITRIVNAALKKSKMDPAAHALIRSVIKTILYVLLSLIVASALGLDITGIVALASVLTLAISLALQDLLGNIIGGFTLLYTDPFDAGDFVEIADQSGTVTEVGIAYTKLVTPDNKLVSIPNSAVVSAEIVNYSALGSRRMEIIVSASYNAPVPKVEAALREAATVENILPEKDVYVSVSAYGDHAISYAVRVWAKNEHYWPVHRLITHRIKEVFDREGIEMTYPHLNVHIDK